MRFPHDILEKIRPRPGLFLGEPGITKLKSFLDGYVTALEELAVCIEQKDLFPLPYTFFCEYVANFYSYYESTSGWRNMILEKNDYNEEKSFDAFFQLWDNFIALTAKKHYRAFISEEQRVFYRTKPYAPWRLDTSKDTHTDESLYQYAKEVHLIELTNNSGYLGLVCTDNKSFLEYGIYTTDQQVKQYFGKCFGEDLQWDKVPPDFIGLEIIL